METQSVVYRNAHNRPRIVCNRLIYENELERILTVVAEDEHKKLAEHLFYLFRNTDRMNDLLDKIFQPMTAKTLQQETNSIPVHLLNQISKSYGQDFLRVCIVPFVSKLKNAKVSLEVDPGKLRKDNLKRNQKRLLKWVNTLWHMLMEHATTMPIPVRLICRILHEEDVILRKGSGGSDDVKSFALVGGYFFLRFFNPGLLQPGNLGSTIEITPRLHRNLMLIAKVFQCIANGGEVFKEYYMGFAKEYVEERVRKLPDLFKFDDANTPRGIWKYTKSPIHNDARVTLSVKYFEELIESTRKCTSKDMMIYDQHPLERRSCRRLINHSPPRRIMRVFSEETVSPRSEKVLTKKIRSARQLSIPKLKFPK